MSKKEIAKSTEELKDDLHYSLLKMQMGSTYIRPWLRENVPLMAARMREACPDSMLRVSLKAELGFNQIQLN